MAQGQYRASVDEGFSADVTHETVRRESWWVDFFGGIALTLLGVAIVFWPVSTLATLVAFVGIFLLAYGAVDIVRGIFSIGENWVWVGSIILGVFSMLAGVIVLRNPGASVVMFLYLLGFYFIIAGLVKTFAPRGLLYEVRMASVVSGVFMVLLGFMLALNPVFGGFTFYWLTGIFALIAGPIQIAFSFRVKHASKRMEELRAARREAAAM